MQAGHVVMDQAGHLLSLDQAFCAIMQSKSEKMLGRQVLDMTAPADRAECAEAIQRLRDTHEPFQLSKRFIRDDATLVWVTNTVSMMEGASGPEVIVATVDPLSTDHDRQPALLLESARFLRACKEERAIVCHSSLFPDTAWDAMLGAYIAEAEGQAINVVSLATSLGTSVDGAARWVRVLLGQNVMEIETSKSDAYSPKCFRLTAETHQRLERHLARVNSRFR